MGFIKLTDTSRAKFHSFLFLEKTHIEIQYWLKHVLHSRMRTVRSCKCYKHTTWLPNKLPTVVLLLLLCNEIDIYAFFVPSLKYHLCSQSPRHKCRSDIAFPIPWIHVFDLPRFLFSEGTQFDVFLEILLLVSFVRAHNSTIVFVGFLPMLLFSHT